MISNLHDLDEKEYKIYVAAIKSCADMVCKNKIPIKEAIKKIMDLVNHLEMFYDKKISDKKRLENVILQEVTQKSS